MKFLLEHVGLAARNPVALAAWYSRILGCQIVFQSASQPPAFLMRMGQGSLLEVYPGDQQGMETHENSRPGLRHLAVRVENLGAARDELAARGVAFVGDVKPAGGGGKVLFFRDPEGNLLHLVEREEGSLQDPF